VFPDATATRIEGLNVTIRYTTGVAGIRLDELNAEDREVVLNQLHLPANYLEKMREANRKSSEAAKQAEELRQRQVEQNKLADAKRAEEESSALAPVYQLLNGHWAMQGFFR
jgi:type IV secretory pathway VirB9-like protein